MGGIGYYICIPFAWLLRVLYQLTASYGWALILFTLAVKIVLLPFQMKSKKSMMRMSRLQPKVKEIQTKYANNQQKINEETQRLYIQEGVNPMGGCLWSLLPFPILIALYSIIREPLSRFMMLGADVLEKIGAHAASLGYTAAEGYYAEVNLAKFISEHFSSFTQFEANGLFRLSYDFLGLDLTTTPSTVLGQFFSGGWPVIGIVLIPVVSAALSVVTSIQSMKQNAATQGGDSSAKSNRLMMWMMPLLSLYIGYTLPAALGVYWIANSFFMIIQEYFLNRYYSSHMEKELTEAEKKKREDRLARMEAAREEQRRREAEYERAHPKPKAKQGGKKAPQTEKKSGVSTNENGRIGDRPYARGRSFSPDHYGE